MKNKNLSTIFLLTAILLTFGLACKNFTSSTSDNKPANTVGTPDEPPTGINPDANPAEPSKVEKADFTMTAEELDKEFTRKGVAGKDLEKYESKNIQVSGRITMLVTEKKGTTQPWVTLYAPGIGHGVSCYFDDENVEQMKQLKEDKTATVQGFQDDFVVPEVSPMLKHCVVIKGS